MESVNIEGTTAPVLASQMSDEQYHSSPRIGRSGLQLFSRSPRHYWAEYLDPNRVRKEPTKAMRIGTALHAAVLEPERVQDKIALEPERWPTKAECGRTQEEQKAQFAQENRRKTILKPEEYACVRGMYQSLMRHPLAAEHLTAPGETEYAVLFDHPLTGSPAKIKPDKLNREMELVIDLKTADDASPSAFARSAVDHWYHVQAAWYLDGLFHTEGRMPAGFLFVVVEKEPPYEIALYYAPPEMLILGRKIYQKQLIRYEECRRKNQWPGYPEELQPITLPRWAYNEQ